MNRLQLFLRLRAFRKAVKRYRAYRDGIAQLENGKGPHLFIPNTGTSLCGARRFLSEGMLRVDVYGDNRPRAVALMGHGRLNGGHWCPRCWAVLVQAFPYAWGGNRYVDQKDAADHRAQDKAAGALF